MIRKGLRRVNGNDNILCHPQWLSCREFFKNICEFNDETVDGMEESFLRRFKKAVVCSLTRNDGEYKGEIDVKMQLRCLVPDLAKITVECMRTTYPLSALRGANDNGVVVLSGVMPLHQNGHFHQIYMGNMDVSSVTSGTRFEGDEDGEKSFRGTPVFLCPGSFTLYPATLPISTGFSVATGVSFFVEITATLSPDSASADDESMLGTPHSLECYLTSAGPAVSLLTPADLAEASQAISTVNSLAEEETYAHVEELDLPSVVYWSRHGKKTAIGKALRDQISDHMTTVAKCFFVGYFEDPYVDKSIGFTYGNYKEAENGTTAVPPAANVTIP